MGLATHAIAFGLGYALATPEGRARLVGLRDQGAQLARRPEVKQVRERAWDAVGDAGLAARNRLTAARARRGDGDGTGGDGTATSSPATSGAAPSGAAASGPAPSGAAASGPAPTGSPAAGTPAPVAVVAVVEEETTAGPDSLAGTTVAEDTRAVLLGLPEADGEPSAPPAERS